MRPLYKRSLAVLAAGGLAFGLFAPAFADPGVPETPEQQRLLGDGSSQAELDPADQPNDVGSTGPGGIPFVPMDHSLRWDLAVDEEVKTPNLDKVASVPKESTPTQATRSNLAFKGDYAFQGSYNGFVTYDISEPTEPKVAKEVVCPGYQGDVSIAGNLLFFSVDQPRTDDTCNSAVASGTGLATSWEGIRIFDITDPEEPQYVKSVATRCGSHTHTLVPNKTDPNRVFVYNAAYDVSGNVNAKCKAPHGQIEILDVPLANPAATTVKEVKLWDGANPAFNQADQDRVRLVVGGATTSVTNGCHDLTAYPAKDLLAAACMGDGLILNISDPNNPTVTERVRDENYAFWHTAQFSNDASKVVFQDELGGGSSATCVPGVAQYRGANAIYTLKNDELKLASYYKIPRRQWGAENCVGHEGNLVQIDGKDVMVQAWYQGGVSLIDFTDATKPKEIGYFDRGPIAPANGGPVTGITLGGYWAAYIHNGYIFGSEIYRGLDVLELKGEEFADANRHRQEVRNPATQDVITFDWKTAPVAANPASLPVASVTPSSVAAGSDTEVTVVVPDGRFEAGEYVDVWSPGAGSKVVGSGRATAAGGVEITFTVPASTPAGAAHFLVRGDKELDSKLFRATVQVTSTSTSTVLQASASTQTYGSAPVRLTAQVVGAEAGAGTVTFKDGAKVLASGVALTNGSAKLTLSKTLSVGAHRITASFVPSSSAFKPSTSAAVRVQVKKATSKVNRTMKAKIKASAKPTVTVKVTAKGLTPAGKVTVRIGGKSVTKALVNGSVKVTLPKFKPGTYKVNVSYAGNATIAGSKAPVATLRVVK